VPIESPLAVLDLETTGIAPGSDRIIEIGIVRTRGLAIERTFSSLVDGGAPVGASVRVHGIDDAALHGAPSLADLQGEILSLLDGATVVAHRGGFDRAFLASAVERGELPSAILEAKWLDTAALSERAFGEGGLRAIATRIEGPMPTHRALPDALAALSAFGAICDVLAPRDVADLLQLQAPHATMRDDVAELFRSAGESGERVGFLYRAVGKRVREDELVVESVAPPYVTGRLVRAGVRRILRGDRIVRAWTGRRPSIRFLDGIPRPTASPDVGGSRS
jgi:DNA polymerase III epsilon subunit-like protein